jgi:hypothetical protein
MDIDNSACHGVPRPLSTAAVQLGLEMDMMKGIPDFSYRLSIPAECQDRIVLTKEHETSGDVEQMGDWDLDKRNPRNWPLSKKWAAVSVVSCPCLFYNWMLNDTIGISLYRRRRYCQFHDGTCFAANRNSIPYHQRDRNPFDSISIHAFLCFQPTLFCAFVGTVRENMGGFPYHDPSAVTFSHIIVQVLHINNLLFIVFNLGCAFAPSKVAFLCFRFLSMLKYDFC